MLEISDNSFATLAESVPAPKPLKYLWYAICRRCWLKKILAMLLQPAIVYCAGHHHLVFCKDQKYNLPLIPYGAEAEKRTQG